MTVDAILEAAGLLLAEHGFEETSTTRIAERAGVSVGSLYEYFPNKQSLVAKLIKRHCDRMIEVFTVRLQGVTSLGMEAVVDAAVEATHAAYAQDWRLHRVLLAEMGRVSRPHHMQRVSLALVDVLEQALASCGAAVRRPSIRLAAFVIESAMEAATHKALLYAPEVFEGELRVELKALAIAYLQTPDRSQ